MSQISKQSLKKKNFFLNEKKKTSRRLKALSEFIQLSNMDQDEETKFYQENGSIVYSLVLDAFSGHPNSTLEKKGKKKQLNQEDSVMFFSHLEKLVITCKEKVRLKWQYRSFAGLMETLCSLKNRPGLRKNGINVLLRFIDILGENADSSIIDVLEGSICFDSFLEEFKHGSVTFRTPPNKLQIVELIIKEETPNEIGERRAIFKTFLQFVLQKTENRQFWFQIFKNSFLTTLYPIISIKVGTLDKNSKTGFQQYCPYLLQKDVVKFLIKGLNNEKSPPIIQKNKQNFKSIDLNNSYLKDIIINCLTIYEIIIKQKESILKDKTFKMCLESLITFTKLIVIGEKGGEEERKGKRKEKEKESDEKTVEQNKLQISNKLYNLVLNKLFNIWISSQTTSSYHWDLLYKLFKQIPKNEIILIQWKKTILHLTLDIHEYFFETTEKFIVENDYEELLNLNKSNIKLQIEKSKLNNYQSKSFKELQLLPSKTSLEKQLPYETFTENLKWTQTDSIFFWKQIFCLCLEYTLQNPPELQYYALSCYLELFNYFITIEDYQKKKLINHKTNPNKMKQIKLGFRNIFFDIFFQCCFLSDDFLKGRALSFGSICYVFSTYNSNIEPNNLSKFYLAVCHGFDLLDFQVGTNIILYSSNIFTKVSRGIFGLINCYLESIRFFFDIENKYEVKNTLALHSIKILNSLIYLQDEYKSIQIFDYGRIFITSENNIKKFEKNIKILEKELERQNTEIESIQKKKSQNRKNKRIKKEIKKQTHILTKLIQSKKLENYNSFLITQNTIRPRLFEVLSQILIYTGAQIIKQPMAVKYLFEFSVQFQYPIKNKILSFLKYDETENDLRFSNDVIILALWTLLNLNVAELNTDEPNLKILEKSFLIFSQFSHSLIEKISFTANSCLKFLFNYSKKIMKLNKNLIYQLILQFSFSISFQIQMLTKKKQEIIHFGKLKRDKDKTLAELIIIPNYIYFLYDSLINLINHLPNMFLQNNKQILQILLKIIYQSSNLMKFPKHLKTIRKKSRSSSSELGINKPRRFSHNKRSKRTRSQYGGVPSQILNKLMETQENNNNNNAGNGNNKDNVNKDNRNNDHDEHNTDLKNNKTKDNSQKQNFENKFGINKIISQKSLNELYSKIDFIEEKKILESNYIEKMERELIAHSRNNNHFSSLIFNFLNFILNQLNNYPSNIGPELNNSIINSFSDLPNGLILQKFINLNNNDNNDDDDNNNDNNNNNFLNLINVQNKYNSFLTLKKINNQKNTNKKRNKNEKIQKFFNNQKEQYEGINYFNYSKIFYTSDSIFVFQELPIKKEKRYVRIILRNSIGKYVWDVQYFPQEFEQFNENDIKNTKKKIKIINGNGKVKEGEGEGEDEDEDKVQDGGDENEDGGDDDDDAKEGENEEKDDDEDEYAKEGEDEDEDEDENEDENEDEDDKEKKEIVKEKEKKERRGSGNSNVGEEKKKKHKRKEKKDKYIHVKGKIPQYNSNVDNSDVDMLDELLTFITESEESYRLKTPRKSPKKSKDPQTVCSSSASSPKYFGEFKLSGQTTEDETHDYSSEFENEIFVDLTNDKDKLSYVHEKKVNTNQNLIKVVSSPTTNFSYENEKIENSENVIKKKKGKFPRLHIRNKKKSKKSLNNQDVPLTPRSRIRKNDNFNSKETLELIKKIEMVQKEQSDLLIKKINKVNNTINNTHNLINNNDDDSDDDHDNNHDDHDDNDSIYRNINKNKNKNGKGNGNNLIKNSGKDQKYSQKSPIRKECKSFVHFCRLFMSQMNFFTEKENYFQSLIWNEDIFNQLRKLDTKATRELLEIPIIYVKANQHTEEEILLNYLETSPMFEQFIQGLGWEINLNNHLGYLGKLANNLNQCKALPYYSDFNHEIIFKILTLIKNDQIKIEKENNEANDHIPKKQNKVQTVKKKDKKSKKKKSINKEKKKNDLDKDEKEKNKDTDKKNINMNKGYKKRNINNFKYNLISDDCIQIIWCEEYNQNFDTTLFNTKMNGIKFIIYPLPNSLFKIQIFTKPDIKIVGPLVNNMITNLYNLPILIRNSIMFTNSYINTYILKKFKNNYQIRQSLIKEIIEKFKIDTSFQDYFKGFFSQKDSLKQIHHYEEILKEL
ncbi:rho gtpase-activating protein [Anaeramoeba flamelloides]|uniref:Rho gtpase-activating protein n=1 Tax=Anaeramoeba flamelloides TaxID=1746091 RepID=A0AAV7ZPE4_9EUKA|nr:rho gtpase-activating protein [Anaeramoeba flamelloides]